MLDDFDIAAANEGSALRRANHRSLPRRPRSIDRSDVKKQGDVLKKLGIIDGKTPILRNSLESTTKRPG